MKRMLTLLTIGLFTMPLAAGCSSDSQADTAQTVPLATASSGDSQPDTAQETQTAYLDAYMAGDVDGQLALVGDDVEFTNIAFNDHREGKASYETLLKWVHLRTDVDATEIVRRFVSDDGAFGTVEIQWIGTRTDGEPFDINMLQVHEYDDDGMLVSVTNYWGDRDAYGQLIG